MYIANVKSDYDKITSSNYDKILDTNSCTNKEKKLR